MTETQNKAGSQGASEQHQQQGQPIYTIPQPAGPPYATIGAYPPYYPYPPPPTDANGHPADPNVANGAPPGAYMMAFPPPPPGMIYAYPTSQGYPAMPFAPGMPLPAALVRPKRKQVKMACTNCATACKRCDEARPCERCCKYGIADTCQDGIRKERKKGIKRGPYKRKGKVNPDATYEGFPPEQNPTEGFYSPYFYPHAGFVPIGPDGQPLQPDAANGATGQAAMAHPQYYPLHPTAYPPFAYPHAAAPYQTVVAAGHLAFVPPNNASNDSAGGSSSANNDHGKTSGANGSSAKDDNAQGSADGHVAGASGTRGKKRRAANNVSSNAGTNGGARDEHGGSASGSGTSKKGGKKVTIQESGDVGGSNTSTAAGEQSSSM